MDLLIAFINYHLIILHAQNRKKKLTKNKCAVTLADLMKGKCLCVTDFPKESLPWIMGALGKFPWKRQKEQKIPHDSSRGSMGYDNLINWLSQSQNSEMYQNVEITC